MYAYPFSQYKFINCLLCGQHQMLDLGFLTLTTNFQNQGSHSVDEQIETLRNWGTSQKSQSDIFNPGLIQILFFYSVWLQQVKSSYILHKDPGCYTLKIS